MLTFLVPTRLHKGIAPGSLRNSRAKLLPQANQIGIRALAFQIGRGLGLPAEIKTFEGGAQLIFSPYLMGESFAFSLAESF